MDVIRSGAFGEAVAHGFFTRNGGHSAGIYASLNAGLGSGDDRETVIRNRTSALEVLGLPADRLATPWQVHSPVAVVTDGPFEGERPKADAVVTAKPGLAVGIVTADCGPILFADEEAGVVGAAHSGWKGAVTGVIEATIEAMESLGARRAGILAVLGPTISQASYEIGGERRDEILAAIGPHGDRFFEAGRVEGKFQFDLPGLILSRLTAAGVTAHDVALCTYGDERFYSYRRTTHRSEADYGRQLSAIAIRG
ncbi:peptidoglycan editing factor PgeF [Fulvimarina endophytica]|uniref:Purine nucleoside phosphorylase n=1 Tax=Fulvimarina endophytica TaxID=2293836 RepID=A0A371X8B2_9HYPH|nr:peptidoglycan editing factor PgeF [Fulvimarina endophytica]RFC65448.1 peptidoglycan editing factor PgeF [Fulvimarina endophytica]